MKKYHAIVIPWPISQGLRTWCGYAHTKALLAAEIDRRLRQSEGAAPKEADRADRGGVWGVPEHVFVGDGSDCTRCGEGIMHYIHLDPAPKEVV